MKIIITVKDTDNVIGLKEDIAMRLEGVADIVRIDTADVVPKSEVERLQAEVDQLHALLECGVFANSVEDWQKFLNEKRAEVAREIFEEIEKFIVRRMIAECTLIDDRLITDIAELKKKYTEA